MRTDHSASREPSLDEQALARRIRQGDEAAFRTLLEVYWRPLVAYASYLLGDADAAGDVVQECLAHLLAEHRRLNITSSLQAYLYRAVHHRAIDHRRRDWRRMLLLRRHYTKELPRTAEFRSEADELPALLQHALDSLPERRRHIFVLAHLHDLPYARIAEILGISPQTVANQISRALASLRSQLEPHADQLLRSGDPDRLPGW